MADVREMIARGIADDPPAVASDPGVIRRGFNAELDELHDITQAGAADYCVDGRARAEADWDWFAEDSLQPDFRFLYRDFEAEFAFGAGGLRAEADFGECGAVYFYGIEGA